MTQVKDAGEARRLGRGKARSAMTLFVRTPSSDWALTSPYKASRRKYPPEVQRYSVMLLAHIKRKTREPKKKRKKYHDRQDFRNACRLDSDSGRLCSVIFPPPFAFAATLKTK